MAKKQKEETQDPNTFSITTTDQTGNTSLIAINKEEVKKYICKNASDEELYMFLNICKSYSLNPFKREIHWVKYGKDPGQAIVGYEVYLKRAERTGNLNGWNAVTKGSGRDMIATVTIHRKDREHPFIWESDAAEFGSGMLHKSMPKFMLKKVAIAQAFRMCFPDECGGLPYMPEELPMQKLSSEQLNTGKTIEGEVVEEDQTKKEEKAKLEKARPKKQKEKVEPEPKPEPEPEPETTPEPEDALEVTGELLTDDTKAKLFGAFDNYGVKEEHLITYLEGLTPDKWTESVRVLLLDIYNSFKNEEQEPAAFIEVNTPE